MPTRSRTAPRRGRPPGARSFDAGVAAAFGSVVREARLAAGISQEALAQMACVERSYFGRIERGQSQPTLYVVLKLAAALGQEAATLVAHLEGVLRAEARPRARRRTVR
jgi:transcriptional regulator with XRE-family HTH domain